MPRNALLRRARRLLALAPLLACGPAAAQGGGAVKEVDVYAGPVLSSARILGLGGAYTGVAEGQDGQPFNVASLANRDRHLNSGWDSDLVLTLATAGLVPPRSQDFDGDGKLDAQLDRALSEVGLAFQAGRFGVGFLFRRLTFTAETPGGNHFSATINDISVGGAYGFLHEQLITGLEVVLGGATFAGASGEPGGAAADYSTPKLRLGVLVRPRYLNFRLGLQFEPGGVATESASYGAPFLEGLHAPQGVALPWVARVGASFWVGKNSSFYNAPSPQERTEELLEAHLNRVPEETYLQPEEGGLQPVLISVEADAVGPAQDAVELSQFVRQASLTPAPAGNGLTVSPHAGAEWEAVHRWIRLRGGGYLEPSRYSGDNRGHGCGGLDLRIPLGLVDLRASVGADFARGYQNISFSLGSWRETGPSSPVAAR